MNGRRVPPQEVEAQEALIGACLISTEAFDTARRIVTTIDFVGIQFQQAWETMCILRDAGESIDPITVAPGVEPVGGRTSMEWLHGLQNLVPSLGNVASYANAVLSASKSRALIMFGADLTEAGYQRQDATAVARRIGTQLLDDERLRRHAEGDLRGFYDDIIQLATDDNRDAHQPWLARGWLRRGQRFMVVAKAGVGKSTLLRQLAFCAAAGVHPLTGQPTERQAKALIVEAEAGEWDIASSRQAIMLALARILNVRPFDVPRPALLHRPGGLDLRDPSGFAALEAAIQRHRPELVVMGPVKYLSQMKPGENYETATLGLHAILNTLIARYDVALGLEAHFSRGDHGSPGGSERWVDWPDLGITLHPAEDDITRPMRVGGIGEEITVRQFRIPRDSDVWVPHQFIRGAARLMPWAVDDRPDPYNAGATIYSARYGALPASQYQTHVQTEF